MSHKNGLSFTLCREIIQLWLKWIWLELFQTKIIMTKLLAVKMTNEFSPEQDLPENHTFLMPLLIGHRNQW